MFFYNKKFALISPLVKTPIYRYRCHMQYNHLEKHIILDEFFFFLIFRRRIKWIRRDGSGSLKIYMKKLCKKIMIRFYI